MGKDNESILHDAYAHGDIFDTDENKFTSNTNEYSCSKDSGNRIFEKKINNFTSHEYVGDCVLPMRRQSFRCDRKKNCRVIRDDIDQVFRSRARIIRVSAVANARA